MCSPGKEMAKASLWLTAGSILTTFDISKAIDESGTVIEPSGEYEPRVIRCVLYSNLQWVKGINIGLQ